MHAANWLKYYPQKFRGVGSFYGSDILKLKSHAGFLTYSMPGDFTKTGKGLRDKIIV